MDDYSVSMRRPSSTVRRGDKLLGVSFLSGGPQKSGYEVQVSRETGVCPEGLSETFRKSWGLVVLTLPY